MLPAENRKARAFFEQALALDPGYAAAQAWLSEAHLGDWAGGWKPAPQESLALGHDCASKAVDLDDTDSRGHTALARASCWYRDLDRARYHFDRALALNPSDAWALASSARCFILEGDADKGLQQIKETVRLNPLGRYGYQLGIGYFARGNYTEAVRPLRSVKDPIDLVYAWLAASLAHAARPMEAVKAASDFEGAFDRRCRECGIEVTQTARIFLAERYPFQRDTDLAHFLEGLEKAGIAL
jgi:tetratricopeptide (TPR) repeat protein